VYEIAWRQLDDLRAQELKASYTSKVLVDESAGARRQLDDLRAR